MTRRIDWWISRSVVKDNAHLSQWDYHYYVITTMLPRPTDSVRKVMGRWCSTYSSIRSCTFTIQALCCNYFNIDSFKSLVELFLQVTGRGVHSSHLSSCSFKSPVDLFIILRKVLLTIDIQHDLPNFTYQYFSVFLCSFGFQSFLCPQTADLVPRGY